MNENTPPLTDAQLRDFARDGCLIVRGAVDAATLEMLRGDFAARVDDLLRRAHAIGKVSAPDGDDFSSAASHLICSAPDTYQHLDISLPLDGNLGARVPAWQKLFGDDWRDEAGVFAAESVFRLLTHPRLAAMAEQLLGEEDLVASPVQHIRIKPPQRRLPPDAASDATYARANWHQDEAVVHESARGADILTVWVAVTESTVENGCLRCVPGSHLSADDACRPDFGLRTHCPGRAFVGDIHIPDASIPQSARRNLEVKPGDAILLHRRTVHGAGANESDGIRWSFDLRYQPAGTPTGRECFPALRLRSNAGARGYRHQWLEARDAIMRGAVEAVFNTRWQKYRDAPLCA
ncbi:MAG: phytanoyl-CoA dioxygenase family protein [Gammaproteobacteria bacterium]|nr:phytanoyl-CoA dioxygenase family protein [Gammaproteobacteria bacterium]